MIDYKQINDITAHLLDLEQTIQQLKDENVLTSTVKEQRECNEWMIQSFSHSIKALEKRKRMLMNGSYEPTNATDILMEAIKDPNYRCMPALLLANQ